VGFDVAGMSGGTESPKPIHRHHGEVSMEAFVKHQMMVILQPFIEQVQQLDSRIAQAEERSETTDGFLSGLKTELDRSKEVVKDFTSALQKVDGRVDGVKEGLEQSAHNHELLHHGVEHTNGWVQRIQDQLNAVAAEVREVKSIAGCFEQRLDAVEGSLNRTDDHVKLDIEGELAKLGGETQELRRQCGSNSGDLQRFKEEFGHKSELLQETRILVDKNVAAIGGLTRSHDMQTARESEMRKQFDGLKSQWSRLYPTVEAIEKDAKFLKQRLDQHDSLVHTLQQNHATNHSNHEALHGAHDRTWREVQMLSQSVKSTKDLVEENRNALARTSDFANALHAGLDKVCADVITTSSRLEGVDKKYIAMKDGLDKANAMTIEVRGDLRRTASDIAHQRHELEKTHEAMNGLRQLLDSATERLSGLTGDVGLANEAVQRLDTSMELCKAGFSGLQRGFVEAGAHLTSRPLTLPRLSKEERLGSTISPGGTRSTRPHTTGPLTARASLNASSTAVVAAGPFGSSSVGSPGDFAAGAPTDAGTAPAHVTEALAGARPAEAGCGSS